MSNIANEIARQVGTRAFCMMGAKNLVGSERALSWKLGRNAGKATHVTVTLDPSDTYTVEFLRCNLRAANLRTVLSSHEGIYCDQLHGLIERETGLALSL